MSQPVLLALIAVASAFVGGGVWSFASVWLTSRFAGDESEKGRLHADLKAMREAHEACEERVNTLERRLDVVEHHHASLVPRWVKNAYKRLVWVNGAAMVAVFGPLGLSRDEVEGRAFGELLDGAVSREIDRLERSALAYPGRAVSTFVQMHPQLAAMHIVTVAGIGRDGELIYEGYAYCANDGADDADRGARRGEEQLGLSLLRTRRPDAAGDAAPKDDD